MPASGVITPQSGLDFSTARAVGFYGGTFNAGNDPGGFYPGPKSRATKVMWRFGKEPGEAHLVVPCAGPAGTEDKVPAVAGVRTSPTEQILRRDLCIVTAQLNPIVDGTENIDDPEIVIFAGRVFAVSPSMKNDAAIIVAKDHRWILDDVAVVGSWWSNVYAVDSDNAPEISYRQGVKIHLNPNNQPNCIWANTINDEGEPIIIPVFCTPFYGLTNASFEGNTDPKGAGFSGGFIPTTIPNPMTMSTTQACYWTPATFWIYIRYHTSKAARDAANALGTGLKFQSYSYVHPLVVWPSGLETTIADNTPQSRKAFERTYHCHKLGPILQDLCEAAGPFSIDMQYNDDGSNTMQIVRTRYLGIDGTQMPSGVSASNSATQGITLTRAIGGQAKNDMTGPTVLDAQLTVSAANLHDVISEVGQHAMIELRWATPKSDGTIEAGYAPLQPTDSQDDTDGANTYLNANWNFDNGDGPYGKDLSKYLPGLFKQYDICASYRVQDGFDFQTGTYQEGFPVAYVGRIPLNQLLTSNAVNGDQFARSNNRYKVSVEINRTDDDMSWELIPDANNMSISGDGSIAFQEFRNKEAQEAKENNATFYRIERSPADDTHPRNLVTLKPNRVRMTLAIPCDHRVTASVCLTSVGNITLGDIDTDDTNEINFDNGIATLAIDTGELLATEERSDVYPSYPIPPSYQITPGVPYPAADAGNNAYGRDNPSTKDASIALFGDSSTLRDDFNYGQDQANRKLREFGRLERNGTMPSDRMDLMAKPGDMIDGIVNTNGTDYPVKAVRKLVEHDFDKQQTISILA